LKIIGILELHYPIAASANFTTSNPFIPFLPPFVQSLYKCPPFALIPTQKYIWHQSKTCLLVVRNAENCGAKQPMDVHLDADFSVRFK